MLSDDEFERLKLVKESFPQAVAFYECNGFRVVAGADLRALEPLGLHAASRWVAFEPVQAYVYMTALTRMGFMVLRANAEEVRRFVAPPAPRHVPQLRSSFLALDPSLLYDTRELEALVNKHWSHSNGRGALLQEFEKLLREQDYRALRDFGELFVYRVGEWYEVETELTTLPADHVKLLALAAFATGQKLPCRVVEPKPRRKHRLPRSLPGNDLEMEQVPLGQLKLPI